METDWQISNDTVVRPDEVCSLSTGVGGAQIQPNPGEFRIL